MSNVKLPGSYAFFQTLVIIYYFHIGDVFATCLFLFFPQNLSLHHAGDVVGALSFSVGHGANILKKVASVRMFHQPHDVPNIRSYPLNKMVSYYILNQFNRICL